MDTYLLPIFAGGKELPLINNGALRLILDRLCNISMSAHALKYFPRRFLISLRPFQDSISLKNEFVVGDSLHSICNNYKRF